MKNFVLSLALVALLGGAVAVPAAMAQTPSPAAAAHPAISHEKIENALSQLGLSRMQKLKILRIVRQGKAAGQDPKATLKQVMGVLTPEQQAKLKQILMAEKG